MLVFQSKQQACCSTLAISHSIPGTTRCVCPVAGYDPAVFSAMAQAVCRDPAAYDAPALVSLLSAAAEVGHTDTGLVSCVAGRLASPHVLASLAPSELAQLAWALALTVGAAGPVAAGGVRGEVEEVVGAVSRQAARKVRSW